MSIGQHLREDFQRGAETMHCTRPAAKAVSNGIEVRLGVQRQVGTDGLVSDVEFGAVWGHPTSVPATCWGPILPGQQGGDHAPEDAPGAAWEPDVRHGVTPSWSAALCWRHRQPSQPHCGPIRARRSRARAPVFGPWPEHCSPAASNWLSSCALRVEAVGTSFLLFTAPYRMARCCSSD